MKPHVKLFTMLSIVYGVLFLLFLVFVYPNLKPSTSLGIIGVVYFLFLVCSIYGVIGALLWAVDMGLNFKHSKKKLWLVLRSSIFLAPIALFFLVVVANALSAIWFQLSTPGLEKY